MSDRTWHDTVTVTLRGRTLRGCGGMILSDRAAVSAIDGEWRIESLYDRPVSPQTSPRVTFESGRMRGNASCNDFSGSFRLERGRLIAGPLASTRKFCALRVQNVQEATILGMFGERMSVSRNRGGKLVLSGPGNGRMVLAPRAGG